MRFRAQFVTPRCCAVYSYSSAPLCSRIGFDNHLDKIDYGKIPKIVHYLDEETDKSQQYYLQIILLI